MNRKIAFTALSLVLVLGGAAGAMAAGKKQHNGAHEASAAESGGKVTDPRHKKGANHESLCATDAQCKGGGGRRQEVKARKLEAQKPGFWNRRAKTGFRKNKTHQRLRQPPRR